MGLSSKTTVKMKVRNEKEVRKMMIKEGDFDVDGLRRPCMTL